MSGFSLKIKMAMAVASVMISVLASMAFFLFSSFEKSYRENLSREQFILVSALAEELDQKIALAQHTLVSFARTFPAHALTDPVRLQLHLQKLATGEQLFLNGLLVFSPTGTLLAVAPAAPELVGRDYSFRPYLRETLASKKTQISAPFLSTLKHGRPTIMFTAPIFGPNGEVLAILGGAVDLLGENFLGRFSQIRLGKSGYFYLYAATDRSVIVHPDRRRILQRDVPPGVNRLFDAAIAGFEGTGETVTSRGQHAFSSFKKLRTRDWILAGNLPASEAFAPINDLRRITFWIFATGSLFTLAGIWLLMRYLTAPLAIFTDRVRQMTADESQRVPIRLKTRDEIGMLANAFDSLLMETERSKRQLQDNLLFHQALVSTLPIPVYYKDQKGIYIGCNTALANLFGCEKEKVIGRTAEDFRHVFSPPADRADVELFGGNPLQVHEVAITPADGPARDMMVFRAPFRDSSGEEAGEVGILLDITDRKRMELEVVRSRDFYLTILDDFPALIWRAGLDAKCNYFNRTWLDFTGRTPEQEMGDGWAEGVHPEDLQRCLDIYLQSFQARRPFAMEYRLRRHDGQYRWMLDIGRPFDDMNGRFTGYIGSLFDISDRRQAVEKLQIFSRATEQGSSAVIITDTAGRIEYINPAFSRLSGYTLDEVAGQTPHLLRTGATSAPEYRHIRQTLLAGRVWQGEFLNRKKNGHFYWAAASISPVLNDQGETTHFVSVQEDITEEKTRQESSYRRRILGDAATEALRVFLQTGKCEDVARVLVQHSTELLQVGFGFFVEWGPPQQLQALLGPGLDSGRAQYLEAQLLALVLRLPFTGNAPCLLLEKKDFPDLVADNALLLNFQLSGKTLAVLGLCNKPGGFSDLDLKDMETFASTAALTLQSICAEKARQLATEHLRVAQKFEAIGQLAGGVAHDFNNLLTVINGYSGMLIRDLADREESRRDAETILVAGQKAADLTRQLLAFSRRQVLKPDVLDLNELIANFRKILLRLLREDVETVWSPADNLGLVKADPGQIEQILINLVVNARDAMPSGGQLFIATGNVRLDEHFAEYNPQVAVGRYVMLLVRDTGVGMTAEVRERIFDPFFTTKEQGQGTGLGLSTVYGIVQQSGGYITVVSTPGEGAEFRIFLPVTEQEQPTAPAEPKQLPAGTETILLVEDEEAVLALTTKLLRQQGYTVLSASRGTEAVALARRQAVDLLITDMIMPEMNGPQLAALLRQEFPGIRVLFMSGHGEFHGQAMANSRQIEFFLQKPFSPEALIGKIARIMERR